MPDTAQAPAKKKFAIGAILLLLYVVIKNYNIFTYSASWETWFSILLLVGFAGVLLCKKDGYAVIIPVALLTCWGFYSYFSYGYGILPGIPWSLLLYTLALACIILLALPGIGVTKLKPYKKIIVYVHD